MLIIGVSALEIVACSLNTAPDVPGRKKHPYRVSALVKQLKKIPGTEKSIPTSDIVSFNSEVEVRQGQVIAEIAHGKLENGNEWYRLVRVLQPETLLKDLFAQEQETLPKTAK